MIFKKVSVEHITQYKTTKQDQDTNYSENGLSTAKKSLLKGCCIFMNDKFQYTSLQVYLPFFFFLKIKF